MKKTIEDKIIKTRQDILLDKNKSSAIKSDPLITLLFIISTNILFITLYANIDNKLNETDPLLILDLFICTISLMLLFISGLKTKEIIFYYLHYIIPNKSYRNQIVETEVQKIKEVIRLNNISFLDDKKFLNLNKLTIEQWISNNISNKRSIKNLVLSRVLGSSQLNMGIIYWSQLLPLSRLDVNQTREALQSCQIVDASINLQDIKPITKSFINQLYKEYTQKELIRLFTSPYYIDHYLKIIQLSQEHNLILPVKKNIGEIYYWVKEMTILKTEGIFEFDYRSTNQWIIDLELSQEIGQVQYITNHAEIERWGYMPSNCLKTTTHPYRSKLIRGESFIFGLWKNNQPYVLFELNSRGGLCEIKKRGNAQLDNEEISNIIRHLNKYVPQK